MKKLVIAALLVYAATAAMAAGSHAIRGHTTKNGTYVPPSHATNPDNKRSTDVILQAIVGLT